MSNYLSNLKSTCCRTVPRLATGNLRFSYPKTLSGGASATAERIFIESLRRQVYEYRNAFNEVKRVLEESKLGRAELEKLDMAHQANRFLSWDNFGSAMMSFKLSQTLALPQFMPSGLPIFSQRQPRGMIVRVRPTFSDVCTQIFPLPIVPAVRYTRFLPTRCIERDRLVSDYGRALEAFRRLVDLYVSRDPNGGTQDTVDKARANIYALRAQIKRHCDRCGCDADWGDADAQPGAEAISV